MAGARTPAALACLLAWCGAVPAGYEEGRQAMQAGNFAGAQREFRAAAGEARADYALGLLQAFGLGMPRDETQAARSFERAATNGHLSAQYNYAVLLFRRRDYKAAIPWMEQAAASGSAQAQSDAGFLYMAERGEGSYQKAVAWLLKAAEQGHRFAQLNLGCVYLAGERAVLASPMGGSRTPHGAQADEAEAVRWFKAAAEQDLSIAQFNLGLLYEQGRGVAADPAEAARWYGAAVRNDFTPAFNNLARLYETGAAPLPPGESTTALRMKASQRGYHWIQTQAILFIHFGARVSPKGPPLDTAPQTSKRMEQVISNYASPELIVDRELRPSR